MQVANRAIDAQCIGQFQKYYLSNVQLLRQYDSHAAFAHHPAASGKRQIRRAFPLQQRAHGVINHIAMETTSSGVLLHRLQPGHLIPRSELLYDLNSAESAVGLPISWRA